MYPKQASNSHAVKDDFELLASTSFVLGSQVCGV